MDENKVREDIIEGLRQSAAGEVFDLGSFEGYAEETLSTDDMRIISGALATIQQMVSVIRRRIET